MPPAELISIVITTYNRSDALAVVLRALALQDDKHFEVVIADDGSTELHRNALAATAIGTGLRIKHVWHPMSVLRQVVLATEGFRPL